MLSAARLRGIALVLCAASLLACERAGVGPRVGLDAPELTATNLDGDSVKLSELRGSIVLLNGWATWCAPCREEFPYLQSLHEQHAADGLTVVGVSIDGDGLTEQIASFARDRGMGYRIWHDPAQRLLNVFEAPGVPVTYLIDRNGRIRWKHLGVTRPTDTTFTRALAEVLAEDGNG